MRATGPGQSTDLLLDVVAILDAEHIDYLVIGALAVAVHGVVRASQDADAVVHASIAELGEVTVKLQALGLNTALMASGPSMHGRLTAQIK